MGPLKKPDCALALAAGGRPLKTVCEVLGVARSGVAAKQARSPDWQDGRSAKPTDDTELVEEIQAHLAHLPTYGYRRIWALLRRSREQASAPCINHMLQLPLRLTVEAAMETYVGLDVSQKSTTVCIVDRDGNTVWRGTAASNPQAIDDVIRQRAPEARRVGMETGPLAVWFYHGLRDRGVPVDCIHARHVHAVLATQLNKTDSNDAYGIAQLTRSGWYRPVEVKSVASHEVRLLLGARSQLISMRTGLYNQIRGVLKTFGVVLPPGTRSTFERLVEQHTPSTSLIHGVIGILLESWKHIDRQVRETDNAIHRIARASDVCRRLMTVPGVGATTAVAFAAAVDNPDRFRRVSDIGPYLGLTPRKYQSGEVDHNGGISKTGCRLIRHVLFEAASVLILRYKRDCALRRWAQSLLPRIGLRKTLVATARKLATLLLSMWRNEKDFIAG
jgi:transposase